MPIMHRLGHIAGGQGQEAGSAGAMLALKYDMQAHWRL